MDSKTEGFFATDQRAQIVTFEQCEFEGAESGTEMDGRFRH